MGMSQLANGIAEDGAVGTRDTSIDEDIDWVPLTGGPFQIGSEQFYPDEGPVHQRAIEPFVIARTPVTNREFAEFVRATGHVTTAEQELPADVYPQLTPGERGPGSLVFTPTTGPVSLDDWSQWWRWVPGADWRHPQGPDSLIDGLEEHPVVQVSYADASAYADWAGVRLPTEAEHEYASSGGIVAQPYPWGSQRTPGGIIMANTWFGAFPYDNRGACGFVGTSPVGSFPPNAFGLLDMIGNVWEWTSDYYTPSHGAWARSPGSPDDTTPTDGQTGCSCGPDVATLATLSAEHGSSVPRRVVKGGSHLCAPEYCLRYRPQARSPQAEDTSTNHIGFRCAK
jgi:formylglycine-generating enzyme required for sulfatase activity